MRIEMLAVVIWISTCCCCIAQPPDSRREYNGRDSAETRPEDQEDRNPRAPRMNPMFAVIDADRDGVISPRELRKAIPALKQLDTDGDGNITLAEVAPPLGPDGRPGGDSTEMVERLMENDRNGDGMLTINEVSPQLARMLQGADQNGDGAIDRQELALAVQNFQAWGGPGRGGPGNFDGPGGSANRSLQRLMQGDRNGDGVLTPDEVAPELRGMLQGADLNRDGQLDSNEVRKAVESARQRFENNRGNRGTRGPQGRDFNPEDLRRPRPDADRAN